MHPVLTIFDAPASFFLVARGLKACRPVKTFPWLSRGLGRGEKYVAPSLCHSAVASAPLATVSHDDVEPLLLPALFHVAVGDHGSRCS